MYEAPKYTIELDQDDFEYIIDLIRIDTSETMWARALLENIKDQIKDQHGSSCDQCGAGMPCSSYPYFLRN